MREGENSLDRQPFEGLAGLSPIDYLCLSWVVPGRHSGGNRSYDCTESRQTYMSSPQSPIDRLKVLLNSSTPIVVMETVEEMRAVSLVRIACSELSLAVFEWSIADGLVRSGSGVAAPQPVAQTWVPQRPDYRAGALPQGNSEADRLVRAVMSSSGSDSGAAPKSAMYNTADPVQALANLETLTVEAAFVLKDFHRHMDNPVVVRRLRDVGPGWQLPIP